MSSPPPALAPVVVDTDALSFVLKSDPARAPRYQRHLVGRHVILPFSVVAELRLWMEERNLGSRRRAAVEAYIQNCGVQYPEDRLCSLWAGIVAEARRRGFPIDAHDAWNAAVALFLDAPLVTHNARHYTGVPGLQTITEPD